MLLNWSDDYLIGIDEVDSQHKEFFTIVHRLHEECLLCEGENVIPEALEFLRNYAIRHFKAEQTLMEEHQYPRIDWHLSLHAKFLDKYAGLMEEFNDLFICPINIIWIT